MEGAHHHQQEVRVCEAVKGIFIYTECVCEKTSEEKGTLFLATEILHHPFYFHGICCLFVCGYMSIFFSQPNSAYWPSVCLLGLFFNLANFCLSACNNKTTVTTRNHTCAHTHKLTPHAMLPPG